MSYYSIAITAATKDDAKRLVAEHFDTHVVLIQKVHQRDRDAIMSVVDAYVDMLADDPEQHLRLQVNGSLSYQRDEADDPSGVTARLSGSSVGVQVWCVPVGTYELTESIK